MKATFLVTVVLHFFTFSVFAQRRTITTETVKVYGNSLLCKSSIEKAASVRRISQANWDLNSKMATIIYNSKKINLETILRNIALAGYDNQAFLAPETAYQALPDSCIYQRDLKPESTTPLPKPDSLPPNHHRVDLPQQELNKTSTVTNELLAVFEAYFTLKDALVTDHPTAASTQANELEKAIKQVSMEKLTPKVHIVWMNNFSNLQADAAQIKHTNSISLQRKYFMRLSLNLYALAQAEKPVEPIYLQYCPMANEGKGAYWLSKDLAIKNPYFGAQMLSCGKTIEWIKQ